MPATLILVSGPAAGSEFPILGESTRIGGSRGCDVYLEGLPANCVTVRFDGEGYEVVNHCDLAFLLEGEPVPPGSAAYWGDGEDLELGPQHQLRLEIDGDPAPEYLEPEDEPADAPAEQADEETAAVVKSEKKRPRTLEIAVILACVVVAAALLWDEESAESATDKPVDFSQTVDALSESLDKTRDERLAILRQTVQQAWIAQRRGRPDEARNYYQLAVAWAGWLDRNSSGQPTKPTETTDLKSSSPDKPATPNALVLTRQFATQQLGILESVGTPEES